MFRGAESFPLTRQAGNFGSSNSIHKEFWRESAEARREVLLPFLWGTVARQGQIFGNPARQAAARSTNGLKFSYPGYSEMFCGLAYPKIDSNAKNGFSGQFEAVYLPGFFAKRKNMRSGARNNTAQSRPFDFRAGNKSRNQLLRVAVKPS